MPCPVLHWRRELFTPLVATRILSEKRSIFSRCNDDIFPCNLSALRHFSVTVRLVPGVEGACMGSLSNVEVEGKDSIYDSALRARIYTSWYD
jgi:hypothetical protein